MEVDQILKRVQWMDDERRKDKDAIAMLENRILALEGSLNASRQQVKELSSEVTRLGTVITRMDQFDANLLQQRVEAKKMVEELDREVKKRQEESEKVHRLEIKAVDTAVFDLRKELEPIPRLEKSILNRVEQETRLGRQIDEVKAKIETVRHSEEEYTRTYRLLEDGRRQDTKRINDILGEVTALRKRVDDQRGQVELVNNNLRKLETRLSELVTVEAERRDVQTAFLDKQSMLHVERDRTWKEWEARFQIVENQATEIEGQLQKLEITHRDAKRSQGILDELTQRVDRRINEITEVQRLAEDRFRQEWVTFKADDQKRWTNYTLTQEEHRNEINRSTEKQTERITQLEDSLQEEQDLFQQMDEHTAKRLQSLLAMVHEWVTAYERSTTRVR
jgi:hypothetical protein